MLPASSLWSTRLKYSHTQVLPAALKRLAAFTLTLCLLAGPASAQDFPDQSLTKLKQISAVLRSQAFCEVPTLVLAQAGQDGMRQELSRRGLDTSFINRHGGWEDQFLEACQRHPKLCQDGTLLSACVSGMAVRLQDPYAAYLTSTTYQGLMNRMNGQEPGGPGLTVVKDHPGDPVEVLEALPDGPASRIGLEPGDHIVSIEGQSTAEMNVEDARGRLQGTPGTHLALVVQRHGAALEKVDVVRATVDPSTVETRLIQQAESRLGYLRVRSFGTQTAGELEQALARLTAAGAEAFLLDLRNNGGGLVTAAVGVCSNFLPEGAQVVTVQRRSLREVLTAPAGNKVRQPLVVLLNHNSASAAEITAGAIHDLRLGTLVGSRSFGKGSVQRFVSLGDGSGLKFTTAQYRTPGGQPINGVGIVPDVVVEDRAAELGTPEDQQLARGVEVVLGRLAAGRRN